jgi:hypothetical protein
MSAFTGDSQLSLQIGQLVVRFHSSLTRRESNLLPLCEPLTPPHPTRASNGTTQSRNTAEGSKNHRTPDPGQPHQPHRGTHPLRSAGCPPDDAAEAPPAAESEGSDLAGPPLSAAPVVPLRLRRPDRVHTCARAVSAGGNVNGPLASNKQAANEPHGGQESKSKRTESDSSPMRRGLSAAHSTTRATQRCQLIA